MMRIDTLGKVKCLFSPIEAHSAELTRDSGTIASGWQDVRSEGLAFLLLILVIIVECLAVIVIIRAMRQDGHKAHASTGRHHESRIASGKRVRVKECGFLAFVVLIIANRDERRDGAERKAFGLADMGGEFNQVLHGVLVGWLFGALVRSFVPPP